MTCPVCHDSRVLPTGVWTFRDGEWRFVPDGKVKGCAGCGLVPICEACDTENARTVAGVCVADPNWRPPKCHLCGAETTGFVALCERPRTRVEVVP